MLPRSALPAHIPSLTSSFTPRIISRFSQKDLSLFCSWTKHQEGRPTMERPFLYLRFLDFALRAPLEMTGEGNISTERSEWRDLLSKTLVPGP